MGEKKKVAMLKRVCEIYKTKKIPHKHTVLFFWMMCSDTMSHCHSFFFSPSPSFHPYHSKTGLGKKKKKVEICTKATYTIFPKKKRHLFFREKSTKQKHTSKVGVNRLGLPAIGGEYVFFFCLRKKKKKGEVKLFNSSTSCSNFSNLTFPARKDTLPHIDIHLTLFVRAPYEPPIP